LPARGTTAPGELPFDADSLSARVLKEGKLSFYKHRTVEAPGPMSCIVSGTEDTPDYGISDLRAASWSGSRLFGVLSLQHTEPNRYTAEDVTNYGDAVAIRLR